MKLGRKQPRPLKRFDPPQADQVGPGFKAALSKMQADDRELSAFDDCLRKSRKAKRSDDSEDVGRAWLAYMEAGRKVREVGKEALSEK